MKLKKVLITLISLAITAGIAVVGITAYKNYQKEKLVAGVLYVSDISWEYEGEETTSYGMLTNDSAQEIYLDEDAKIETVYVKQGDTVAVGDALLKYDTAEVENDIKSKELELESIKNTLEKEKHELEKLRKIKPVEKNHQEEDFYSEDYDEENFSEGNYGEDETETEEVIDSVPEKDEKDERIYNYLTAESVAYNEETANGSIEHPYIYFVNENAYAYGSFYNSLRASEEEAEKNVVLIACMKDKDGKMSFRSEKMIADVLAQMGKVEELTPEELEEYYELEQELRLPLADDSLEKNTIYISGASLPGEYEEERRWYIFSGVEVEETDSEEWEIEDDYWDDTEEWESEDEYWDESEESDEERYTKKELAEAIREKEKEVKSIDIEKRTLELTLNSMKEMNEDGTIYAKVDGIVKSVADIDSANATGEVFMVVTKDMGLYVSGTVSELLLDKVTPGTTVVANSWETGQTFEATVTEISDIPVSESEWYEGNPNVSYYQYTAFVEDSSELKNGEYVDLLIQAEAEEGLYIEKAYVRQENGQSYVMIADENERLKKQYVMTGKTIYEGEAIEIKAGLTEDDRIAFPYGDGAIEGIKVTEDYELEY